jgi:hypothetical protein
VCVCASKIPFPNCQTVILFYFNALRIADLGSKELGQSLQYVTVT